VLDSQIFVPREGSLPIITLQITSLSSPNKPCVVEVPEKTVEQIWKDYWPYLVVKKK